MLSLLSSRKRHFFLIGIKKVKKNKKAQANKRVFIEELTATNTSSDAI
jgi:hypothetical protein